MRYFLLAPLLFVLSLFSLQAQPIEGRVLDGHHLLPIEGVTVEIRSFGQMTQTGSDGGFLIEPRYYPCSLLVYHTGYLARIIPLTSAPEKALDILIKPAVYELDSVMIVAGEAEQTLRAQAGSVTLIRQPELQRDNNLSIAPALNRVPGVQMQQGALNTARISIRGIGARNPFGTAKIRAYFEDIPLTDGTGGTSIEDLDLSFIQTAEVLRGPTSSIYGAGLGGTIRLSAAAPEWNQTRVRVGAQAGSFGLRRFTATAATSGETSSLHLALNNTHSDGFRDNSTYDRSSANLVARIVPDRNNSLLWIGQFARVKAFIPSSIDSSTFVDDPSAAAFTWAKTAGYESYDRAFTGLSWRHRYGDHVEHWISVFGGFRDAYEPRPFNMLREGSVQQGARARWIFRQKTWRLTAGTEVFRETYDWSTYENIGGNGDRGAILSDNEELRQYANGFVQARGNVTDRLAWEAGTNLNTTRYDFTDYFNPDSTNLSGTYTFSPTLSPRAALTWNAPQWTARVQLSHGFSPPTLEETLTPEGQINPEIQPETGWNLEAGWRGYLLPDKLWADATVYRMWVSDLLVARRIGNDQFVGVNAGKSLHQGVELALHATPVVEWRFWANYAGQFFRFTDFVDDDQDYSGNAVTGLPRHQLTAGVERHLFGKATVMLTGRYVSAIPLRDDNSIYSDAYALLNARVNSLHYFPGFSWGVQVFGGVNNILNASYASMVQINAGSFGGNQPRYYYPGSPREWYLGVNLLFNHRNR